MKTFLVEHPWPYMLLGEGFAIGGVPAFIVGILDLLEGSQGQADRPEYWGATIGLLIVSGALLTWRCRATIDPATRTVTWTRHVLGFAWTSAVWSAADVREIREGRRSGKGGFHVAVLCGEARMRLLCSGSQATVSDIARTAKRALRRPLKLISGSERIRV